MQMSGLSHLFAGAQSNILHPLFTSVSTVPPHSRFSLPIFSLHKFQISYILFVLFFPPQSHFATLLASPCPTAPLLFYGSLHSSKIMTFLALPRTSAGFSVCFWIEFTALSPPLPSISTSVCIYFKMQACPLTFGLIRFEDTLCLQSYCSSVISYLVIVSDFPLSILFSFTMSHTVCHSILL